MSYARTLRRAMKPHLQPDGNKIIDGYVSIYRTLKGMFYGARYINPTRGWRYPGLRSAHATLLTAEVKGGLRPWSSHAFQDMLRTEGMIHG